MPRHRDDSVARRASLLMRPKCRENKSNWRQFYDTCWKLLYGVVIKSSLTTVETQEAGQETVITIAKNIRDFPHDTAANLVEVGAVM